MNKEREELTPYVSSEGESRAQQMLGTGRRATAFYRNQMERELKDTMQSFVARQEMVVLATGNAHGECRQHS